MEYILSLSILLGNPMMFVKMFDCTYVTHAAVRDMAFFICCPHSSANPCQMGLGLRNKFLIQDPKTINSPTQSVLHVINETNNRKVYVGS